MDVTGPIQVKAILTALDLDGGLVWRGVAGREKIEGVGWSADSLDVEEIFALFIEGIKVVPEKIGICFGSVSTRFTEGSVAKGHGTLSGLSDDASITKYSPSGAGINSGPSPTVACAVWESRVLVGCRKKSALIGRLRPGGRGIVGGTLGRGHAFPIKVKGHGSIRPSGDLLWRPVDQDTGFPKAEAIFRGELDFEKSLRMRVQLLSGLKEDILLDVAKRLRLNEGAEYLLKRLRQLGFKTAIVSGGFLFFASRLQSILDVDYVFANELDIVDGHLSGGLKGEIIDGNRKAELLCELAIQEGLHLEQVIAVGDGANDLPMLQAAGMGVAFKAKPLVRVSAQYAISHSGLDGILYLMGYSDRDLQALGSV